MAQEKFYVYQYLTGNDIPFYIGKGSKNRINESHEPWIAIPSIEYRKIIKDNLNENEAFDLELELIKKYGRKIDGGILENKKVNRWVSQAGWKHTEEAKEKISKGNIGKIRTEKQKENYRKPKSPQHIEKIRLANLGRVDSEERKNKIRETLKKKKWFTDGNISLFCEPGMQPSNFRLGRILRRKSNGVA